MTAIKINELEILKQISHLVAKKFIEISANCSSWHQTDVFVQVSNEFSECWPCPQMRAEVDQQKRSLVYPAEIVSAQDDPGGTLLWWYWEAPWCWPYIVQTNCAHVCSWALDFGPRNAPIASFQTIFNFVTLLEKWNSKRWCRFPPFSLNKTNSTTISS